MNFVAWKILVPPFGAVSTDNTLGTMSQVQNQGYHEIATGLQQTWLMLI